MDFNFSDEQEQLRDAVARWVAGSYDFDQRKKIVEGGGVDRKVYNQLAELGLTALYVDEANGGLDMGPVESMVVLEELGRGLVTEPLAQAYVCSGIIRAYGDDEVKATWLPRIASGEALVVLAHQERQARYRLDDCQASATQAGDGYTIRGLKNLVPAGDQADAYLVPAMLDGSMSLFIVERQASGVATRGYLTQDESRAGDVEFNDAPAQRITADGLTALTHAVDIGIACACAEAVGTMERLLRMTVEYMNQRKQFGVPISSFQALRFRAADMKMALELARGMSYYANLKLSAPEDERRLAIARAKIQLGLSMRQLGQDAVQLHGGIGVTDEYAGSHYFKRLTQLEMTWGDTLHHQAYLSGHMQEHAGAFT